MARKRFKTVMVKSAVDDFLSGAVAEIEELAGEMREWAENMEAGGLGHTDKYQEVEAAADALENIYLEVDLPEAVVSLIGSIETMNSTPYGRKPMSRSMRASNTAAVLSAVAETLDEYRDEELYSTDIIESVDSQIEQCENAANELEAVEFPSMF